MQEIERKFLVNSTAYKEEAFKQEKVVQGFLNRDPERTVRVRRKGESAFLTIKGKSENQGRSRFEWEKEIGTEEADALFKICEAGIIEKTRYLVKVEKHLFEVDEFAGDNEGLVVAEVELSAVEEQFERPDWLSEEVTGEKEYYNSQLSKNPYKNWSK